MFFVSSGSENIDNNLLHLLPLLALCKFYGQIIGNFILIADSKILNINRCFVIDNPTQMSKRCSLLTNAMTWHCQLVLFTQKSMSNNIDEYLFNYPIVQIETLTLTYYSSKLEPWKENLLQDTMNYCTEATEHIMDYCTATSTKCCRAQAYIHLCEKQWRLFQFLCEFWLNGLISTIGEICNGASKSTAGFFLFFRCYVFLHRDLVCCITPRRLVI